nr:CotS family spore coat protein [Neobacillus sp. Marseille-Q6967]
MEKNSIVAWGINEQTPKNFVPEYIINMAEEVVQNYDFTVKSMQVMSTKPFKGGAIWKLDTSSGPKSLKLLHRRPTRSLFSIAAQEYLANVKEARVPPIVKTKKGNLYVEAGGKLWFVAEWIEPLVHASKDLEGAKKLSNAIGEFHRLSKGYVPPPEAEIASRLHKWPKYYQKIIRKMDWFRTIAMAYNEMPASDPLLNVIDQFQQQAVKGLESLNSSSYFELMKEGNEYWGLVHQDYGWGNGQMSKDGMWIIDLDGVGYDISIRDLRKLISHAMVILGRWDTTWVRQIIEAYHEANPISNPLYELLLIDLSMPNELYKDVKAMVYEPELFLNDKTAVLINTIVEIDKTKWPVLEEIKNDWRAKK